VLNLWTISEEWVCCIPERGTGKHLWTGFVLPGLQKYSLYGDVCEMSNSAFDCNVPSLCRFAVDGEESEQSELLYPRYLLTLLATVV